jgi:hypothetical protein
MPPNIDDPLRTTDHAPVPEPEAPPDREGGATPSDLTGQATATFQPNPAAASRDGSATTPSEPPPSIPGYQIERVLGRGGMGVVYKARHLSLKRTVALKMIRGSGHAEPGELARFRIEAEAVARLLHPHIVQIHDVGEADGHPYCALEFVEGGNLAGKLNDKPLPAREAARLVEALARAMQLAHSRNVVHRDLKPANILMAADGTPKITDFGLARQLDSDSGETQTGAVLGTPSYMAPEQASGHAHEAGPPADVYALGAILYECLTGRPPFKGRTVVETLDRVRTQEPAPLSRWQPRVPLDLETICLKCLRKEPEKRYASAAELADELVRYQNGEPIQARAVGRVERGWRWCRRNPALAVAVATVVVVLVAASVVSTLFGLDARNEANAAVEARDALGTKNTELELTVTELKQTQDRVERALARTWLSPLSMDSRSPLNDAEIGALDEVAAFRNKPLAERFLAEALANAQGIRKLRARSAVALQAIVGLDVRARQEVERHLVRALEGPDLGDEARTDLAVAASELGELSPSAAAVLAQTLLQALTRPKDAHGLLPLAQSLSVVADRLAPKEAAGTLTQAMTRTNDLNALAALAQGLSAVVPRLEPREAEEVAAKLTQAMTGTTDANALAGMAHGLSGVAARLEPGEAARWCAEAAATLTQAVKTKTTDPYAPALLAEGLSAVAAHMEPRAAVATLTQALTDAKDPRVLDLLARGLSALAARLEPKEAVAMLTQAATRTKNPGALAVLEQGLSAATARQKAGEPVPASAQAAALAQAMTRTNDLRTLLSLARDLTAVAARLEPEVGARRYAEAAGALTQAMTRTNDPAVLAALAQNLSEILGQDRPLQRAVAVAGPVGFLHDGHGLPCAVVLLRQAVEPFPRRLSDQTLVDLLKGPLCVGPARRVVLDILQQHHQRAFIDQWDFVRFAEVKKLSLDFTSPPRRPG